MRQIVLDTETTGLYANDGDRIIEIGCVEIINRRVTKNHFHQYINPERDSHEDAVAIHGLTTESLRRFATTSAMPSSSSITPPSIWVF